MITRFRAWDNSEKKFVTYPVYIGSDGDIYWEHYERGLQEDNSLNICMSTGLKDKNGVEIYEGDILQSDHYFKYQVVFKGDCWRCEPLKNKRFKNRFIGGDLEVIGNIYKNPELFEVAE